MKAVSSFTEIFIYRRVVDFRKSIDGLSEIAKSEMNKAPFSGALFVFMSRKRDRVKILYWDQTGFALWYKRLEEAKFAWPRKKRTDVDLFVDEIYVSLTSEQLQWLLSGVDVWKIKPHESLSYENIS